MAAVEEVVEAAELVDEVIPPLDPRSLVIGAVIGGALVLSVQYYRKARKANRAVHVDTVIVQAEQHESD